MDRLLTKIDNRYAEVQIQVQGSDISGSGMVHLQNVHIHAHGQVYVLPEVQLKPGLSPLIRVIIDTGYELVLEFKIGKKAAIHGMLDLARIFSSTDISGVLQADALLFFEDWGGPPVQGDLYIKSVTPLDIEAGVELENVVLDASLDGQRLEISRFAFSSPVPLSSTGMLELNWSDLMDSIYQVQGGYSINESRSEFRQQGRLRQWLP